MGAVRRSASVLALATVVLASGCGGGSGHDVPFPDVTSAQIKQALLAYDKEPAKSASCRAATAKERSRKPFAKNHAPLFVCKLSYGGSPVLYDVQVLNNGCLAADRRGGGHGLVACDALR
jgi:hypothetical protein